MATSLGEIMRAAAWGSERSAFPVRGISTRLASFYGSVNSRTTAAQLADAARLINALLGVGELRALATEVLSVKATAVGQARLAAQTVTGHLLFRP